MAVPAKKVSRMRRGKRRAHQRAPFATLADCPECGAPRYPHHVCRHCGSYNGREVVSAPEPDTDEDYDE